MSEEELKKVYNLLISEDSLIIESGLVILLTKTLVFKNSSTPSSTDKLLKTYSFLMISGEIEVN